MCRPLDVRVRQDSSSVEAHNEGEAAIVPLSHDEEQQESMMRIRHNEPSSSSSNIDGDDSSFSVDTPCNNRSNKKRQRYSYVLGTKVKMLDLTLFAAYLCSSIAITTPVVLIPSMAVDGTAAAAAGTFAVTVTSLATQGGAMGKFLNGFVCQSLGATKSATWYLLGLALSSALLSVAPGGSVTGIAVACFAMEFCNSIMWPSFLVIFATHYDADAEAFASAITMLSLASTIGTFTCKIVVSYLLMTMHWRQVALIGGTFALVSMCIVVALVRDSPERKHDPQNGGGNSGGKISLVEITASAKGVLTHPLFWKVGIAHAISTLAMTSDRILGTYFQDDLGVPEHLSGGLTSFVTVGFLIGSITGSRRFNALDSPQDKKSFLNRRYVTAVGATLMLAWCSHGTVKTYLFFGDSFLWLRTALVMIASAVMASSMSFQFYQLTAFFAKTMGPLKAVTISFMDAVGFLLSGWIWKGMGQLISSNGESGGTGPEGNGNGWSLAFLSLALWYAVGGFFMMSAVPVFMEWTKQQRFSSPPPCRNSASTSTIQGDAKSALPDV